MEIENLFSVKHFHIVNMQISKYLSGQLIPAIGDYDCENTWSDNRYSNMRSGNHFMAHVYGQINAALWFLYKYCC